MVRDRSPGSQGRSERSRFRPLSNFGKMAKNKIVGKRTGVPALSLSQNLFPLSFQVGTGAEKVRGHSSLGFEPYFWIRIGLTGNLFLRKMGQFCHFLGAACLRPFFWHLEDGGLQKMLVGSKPSLTFILGLLD